jgi:hypothetical protein
MDLGATASAQGRQFNGAPFPASVTAQGRQFNGAPSPRWGEAMVMRDVFLRNCFSDGWSGLVWVPVVGSTQRQGFQRR